MSTNKIIKIDTTKPSTILQHIPALESSLAAPQINRQTLAVLRTGNGPRPNETLVVTKQAQFHRLTTNTESVMATYPCNKADNTFANKLTLSKLKLPNDNPLPVTNFKYALIPLGSYKDRSVNWVNLQDIVQIDAITRDTACIVLACTEAPLPTELHLLVRQSQRWLYEQVQTAYILYRNALAQHNYEAWAFDASPVPAMPICASLQKILNRIDKSLISPVDQPLVTIADINAARTFAAYYFHGSRWWHEVLDSTSHDKTEPFKLPFDLQQNAQTWVTHPNDMHTRFAKKICTPTKSRRDLFRTFFAALNISPEFYHDSEQ
ncbi:hypothetical protein EQG49_04395 [Periweissella cryptocerci]|uniref:Uncharacterized protein n=1 Tax=Periweissella cryptocerci TaxID=2506420 RepID=A0A4V1AIJ8_9LACO|nr:hypothetical protein [Periweissella cryptocerci]QBO35755.1 hypothetical protein EQG49_04395 [Periweissella cryptocerci]